MRVCVWRMWDGDVMDAGSRMDMQDGGEGRIFGGPPECAARLRERLYFSLAGVCFSPLSECLSLRVGCGWRARFRDSLVHTKILHF